MRIKSALEQRYLPYLIVLIAWFCLIPMLKADVILVSSQDDFDSAHDAAGMNDTIVWNTGVYLDIYMNITKDHLFVKSDTLGGTIFTGASRVNISGDYITLQGFQFLDGDIGTNTVINTSGSYNHFTQINIRAYTSYKYLRIREESQYVDVSYCNFENRLNLDDQNILSILVDETNPGYHKIQYCSFKNFDGTGNDLGIEPIRIGLSTQADRISRSLVEFCYFTQCNGDGELISSKATQNVYRYNTFENNPKAELVLRHGSQAIVYGNFFLNGKGGIRVREGQDHYIYNNYFYDLDDRAIYLQNEESDPLDNINIAFNTIINCSEIILGGDGNDKPTNVSFSNNIFADPKDALFEEPTGTETWSANIASGKLGFSVPSEGVTVIDPKLIQNNEGFFGLEESSPAIDAAQQGYAQLPQFDGIEGIDAEILFDLMGQERPASDNEKDLGCNEFPHNITIRPFATEENTGPDYNTTSTTGIKGDLPGFKNFIQIYPNPANDTIFMVIESEHPTRIKIDIYDVEGTLFKSIPGEIRTAGKRIISQDLMGLSPGLYTIIAFSQNLNNTDYHVQSTNFIKL